MTIIANRELGTKVPVSIPTAIAIEELTTRHKNEKLTLWINIRTLIRNLISTFSVDDARTLTVDDIATTISEEAYLIVEYVRSYTDEKINVVFYNAVRGSLDRHFKYALLKKLKTDRQKALWHTSEMVLNKVVRESNINILSFDIKLKGGNRDAMLLTHQPIDLLSRYEFGTVRLLESHTGKVKESVEWNSKLTGKDTDSLPFNILTLQVFGDNETFSSMFTAMKRGVLEIAEKGKWTPLTSMEKITSDINRYGDEKIKDTLIQLIRVASRFQ